jgi:hypothetical protein
MSTYPSAVRLPPHDGRGRAWRVVLSLACWVLLQALPAGAVPSGTGAARLEFAVNEQILVPWGYVDLRYRIKSFEPGVHADLYLGIRFGGGSEQCTDPSAVFTSELAAYATDLVLSDSEAAVNTGFLPQNVDRLVMTLYGVLVAHGTSPADPANWVSNLASLDLLMGPLSSKQLEILAERGNPSAYLIQFFYDKKQRIESWRYEGGGLGQLFQFVNGRSIATGGENDRARASVPTPSTFYDPGRFGPATTPDDIRALLGDPDRVIQHSPGNRAWIYKNSGITVSLEGGLIRQIEVH